MPSTRTETIRCPFMDEMATDTCSLSGLLENLNLGIGVLDLDHRKLIFLNATARSQLPKEPASWDFEAMKNLLFPDKDLELLGAEQAPEPASLRVEDRFLGFTLYRPDPRYIWIFLRDVTEKMRLENIAEAVNLIEHVGFVFAGISHEMGNPINAIKATLSVLNENLDHFSKEKVGEYTQRVMGELSKMEDLLKSLKHYSMFADPMIQKLDLHFFLDRFAKLSAKDLVKWDITLTMEVSPVWVQADARALQQVLLNLVSNAAEALRKGRKTDRQIKISAQPQNDLIQILVEDNGPGIPAGKRENLFTPFYTTKPEGTGLGLVISRKLMVAMNGYIDAEASPRGGTRVILTLPSGGDHASN